MKRIVASLAGLVAVLVPVSAEAQLVRQTVQGIWRQCIYESRAWTGSANPRQRLGTARQRVIQVGRGEPCPATYPGDRRERRSTPPVSTWPQDPPAIPR